jgi:SAM-dependent methyltransferase
MTYWNQFYGGRKAPGTPSDFAIFVANQFPQLAFVIDIGCGNGRDSLFFLGLGVPVLSVDQSETAISALQKNHTGENLVSFVADIGSPDLILRMERWLQSIESVNEGVVYARFFLHAITDEQEAAFLNTVSELVKVHRIAICLEFRTQQDAERTKVTAHHYRRYLDPRAFMSRANAAGLRATYFTEGLGFARLGADDAHVARIFLSSEME